MTFFPLLPARNVFECGDACALPPRGEAYALSSLIPQHTYQCTYTHRQQHTEEIHTHTERERERDEIYICITKHTNRHIQHSSQTLTHTHTQLTQTEYISHKTKQDKTKQNKTIQKNRTKLPYLSSHLSGVHADICMLSLFPTQLPSLSLEQRSRPKRPNFRFRLGFRD